MNMKRNRSMNETEKELKKLLEKIPGSYSDFVIGVLCFAKTDDAKKKMIEYIKSNDNLRTSAVLKYLDVANGVE